MEEKYLVDICNPKQWKTIPKSELIEDGEFPVYGANGIIGRYNKYNHEKPTVLITCRGATCGNIHITVPKSYINGNAMSLDDLNESKCKKDYLYYFLKYYDLSKIISGTAQPQITINGLKKVKVKLYSIEKQEKIVDELNKINKVISLKKSQLEELSSFIKSQFVEMFGIPFLNNKNWTLGIIKELVREVKYGTSKPANGGKYKYLRMNNITYEGKLDLNEMKYIDIEKDDKEKYVTKKGDILFNRTNSKELVGKTCVFDVEEEMIIAGFIIRVRVNDFANPYFISEYLNTVYLKDKLRNMCKDASGQSNINAKELQNIKIYIPPITLQNQFSEIVKQIDKQKFESMIQLDKENRIVLTNIIKDTLEETNMIYEFLLRKYF